MGGNQRFGTRQTQDLSKMIADAAPDRIEIGVAGDDTDAVTGGIGDKSAGGGVGADGFEGPENNGVVGDNQIVPTGSGLIDQGAGGVKRQQDAAHRLVRITDQEADIVPLLGQVFRGDVLQNFKKVSNCRHSITL